MAITDYGYKRKITIDHTVVDTTETDYPAMVKLYQDDTAPTWSSSGSYTENDVVVYNNQYFRKTSTANNKEPYVDTDWNLDWTYLGEHLDFSLVRSDGYDFRFYANDESTELDYERELFDTTDPYQAVFHIRIPSVSSSVDTDYYMYYGYASATDSENVTGVWDSNFVMVQHMGDSLVDSTNNGNDGTNNGTIVIDGLNGKARSFDGSNDYIETSSYTDGSDITITTLFKTTNVSEQNPIISKWYSGELSWLLDIFSSNLRFLVRDGDGSGGDIITQNSLSTDINYLHSAVFKDSDFGKTVLNLSQVIDTSVTSIPFKTNPVQIGKKGDSSTVWYEGIIDEVRISDTARSDAWIKMDDANLRTWSLQSIGVEEEVTATNTTEPLAKTLIDENLVNATDTDRNISILSVVENQGRGTVQEVQTSNERLDKILEKILAVDDYGHKIYIDDGLKYDVIVPETKSVQFSNKIYNLLEARQQLSESNYKTFVYIDGDTTSNTYGTSTGFDRKELYLSTTTDTGLQDKAKQELDGKYYQTNAIQGKIRIVGNPFEYKTDYDLGDIVTVIFNDTVYTVQITEVTETYSPNGFELDLTFGTPRRDFSTLIQDIKEAK